MTRPMTSPASQAQGGAGGPSADEQLAFWPEEGPAAGLRPAPRERPPHTAMEETSGWPLSVVHAPWARRTLVGLAAAGLGATLLPRSARAVIPVVDTGAITQLVYTVSRLATQIRIMTDQYNAFVNNTRKLTSGYAWRNIGAAVNAVDGVVSSGLALSYSTAGLAGQIGATFPGYSYDPLTINAATRNQQQRALSTAMQQILGAQQTWAQISQSVLTINQIKAQVAGITSAQQAAEVNATIGVAGVEEMTLLRQQLLAAQSAQAVFAAHEANRELQGAASVQALFTAPAQALTTSPPTRPKMDPVAYAF
jgi:P-type conjugative transfer protein TrbJ